MIDVRKWVKATHRIADDACVHLESDCVPCPECIADAFAPAITKLVDCLEEIETKGQCDFLKVHSVLEEFRRSALAELEKP